MRVQCSHALLLCVQLDPSNAKSTLEEQKERAAAASAPKPVYGDAGVVEDGPAAGGAAAAPALTWNLPSGGASDSKAQLAERLQRRIQEARAKRKAEEHAARVATAKEWKQAVLSGEGRTPPSTPGGGGGGASSGRPSPGAGATPLASPHSRGAGPSPAPATTPAGQATLALQFGRIAGVEVGGSRRAKKATRDRVAALAAVEARQAEVQDAGGATTAEGQALLAKQSWQAALARASGEKVLDDPKLLKKSIKRAAQAKQQRRAAWQQRVEAQEQKQEDRQAKRRDNLQQRADDKVAKRIERREKKLLQRPGFEGRKGEAFLNN